MVNLAQSPYTDGQITAWLRGLLTIAWADGDYDQQEKELVAKITQELALSNQNPVEFKSITATELATQLGKDKNTGENFLRTAVLVALADGVYSTPEVEILYQYRDALGLEVEALKSLEATLYPLKKSKGESQVEAKPVHPDLLCPVKDWLDGMEIDDPRVAKFLCKMIPAQCPFERDITLFNHKIVHIPPLCKLNPLYEQLVGLRFRALSYLADDCKEDVSDYV